jgi:hypothetical protein
MIPAPRESAARRFPLVPRARPACHQLDVRVRQLACLAGTAAAAPAGASRTAAEASNLGALIASDCGPPDLARDLWRRQFEIWRGARPFRAATAKLALSPLINLGRLRARDGDGIAAHHLIETLFTAVRHQAAAELDGLVTDLGDLTRTPADHREIIQWLWTVLVADGTRALAHVGLWGQALHHVQDNRGISRSLQDAYAAREVIAHPGCASLIPASAIGALDRLVDASGLGAGNIPTGVTVSAWASVASAAVVAVVSWSKSPWRP